MAETTADRYVEYLPLDEVEHAPRNPKGHDEAGIARSIGHFGFAELPLLDERTGRLVAGHGRHEQLVAMQAEGAEPPEGVRVGEDGRWLMPVIRGWRSRSDDDAEAYLVASNRLTMKAGWDDHGLAEILTDLADAQLLEFAGYAPDELEALLAGLDDLAAAEEPVAHTDVDDTPEPPAEPRTRPGDVWRLGPHRVLCGDATDLAAVEAMLAGDRPRVLWTDPPYGVDYVGGPRELGVTDRLAWGGQTIANDGVDGLAELLAGAFAVATAVCEPGAAFYVAYADMVREVFEPAVRAAGWNFRQNLIWVKDHFALGHADHHWRHEPIMYGFLPGGDGRRGRGANGWYGDNTQSTVFEVKKPQRSAEHPTMKPVELVQRQLANSCPRGAVVLDLFGGSGTTLIAAHHHGALARVVELDPRFVDVICRRYQEHTGTLPVLDATGEEHDFTAGPEAA